MSGAPVETPEAALREKVAVTVMREMQPLVDRITMPTHAAVLSGCAYAAADRILAALAAPSVAPLQPGKLFWPTDPAHPCPTCGASVLTQEPAAPCIGCGGARFRIDNATGDQVPCECTSMFAAPPAQGTEPCPCGDGPGHGPEWCEDYTEKARIDAAVAAERKRCATLVYRAMTLSQVVDQNIKKALDAIRAAAPSQSQPSEVDNGGS